MSVTSLRNEIKGLKQVIEPDIPNALVVFLDENENIVEIQGKDVTSCTQEEIDAILNSTPIHYYLPKPDPDDFE